MTHSATSPLETLKENLKLMLREGRRRVVVLAALFAAVALATLAYGVLKPKEYEAQTVILVEAKNIIAPLMEGRAVTTGATDEAAIVAQAMWSRRILREVLAVAGWGAFKDPRVEERMLNKLAARIRIVRQRPELIKLAYMDTDPERALAVTRKLAEIYMREALGGKARESSAAFEFIDRQVNEYAAKVAEAHEHVQEYFRKHGDPRREAPRLPPPMPAARPSGPRVSSEELAALRAEEAKLAADVAAIDARQQRRSERIDQLQRELDNLLGTYTDKHPNVRRAREELQNAKQDAVKAAAVEDRTARAHRARLEDVRGKLGAAADGAAAARDGRGQAYLAVMPQPTAAELLATQDATLTELLRQYESARDVYQDLLKRRENARVSMELDAEQRGLTLRVYEEPELPALPVGMRLLHVTVIGLFLGAAVPLGLLFAFVRFDPRVRSPQQLERFALAPLLVTIPYAPTAQAQARERRRVVIAAAVVACVFATYAVFFVVRLGVDLDDVVGLGRRFFS